VQLFGPSGFSYTKLEKTMSDDWKGSAGSVVEMLAEAERAAWAMWERIILNDDDIPDKEKRDAAAIDMLTATELPSLVRYEAIKSFIHMQIDEAELEFDANRGAEFQAIEDWLYRIVGERIT
jgi:hypothetical protein